jgi:hypothetical protein
MTRAAFLQHYEALLESKYPWAVSPEKRASFMAKIIDTLDREKPGGPWNPDGPTTVDAWRAIGGRGKPSMKALRALPH